VCFILVVFIIISSFSFLLINNMSPTKRTCNFIFILFLKFVNFFYIFCSLDSYSLHPIKCTCSH
jgi:hypothetical protein